MTIYHHKENLRSPVGTHIKERKEANMDKININIGSVVKANVGYIEDKTKEGTSRSIHKEVT